MPSCQTFVAGKKVGDRVRPAKQIILLAPESDKTSILRYVLRNSSHRNNRGCYRVASVDNSEQALRLLKSSPHDVLIVVAPIRGLSYLLLQAKMIDGLLRTLVIAEKASQIDAAYPDEFLFNPQPVEILDALRALVKRKHGPRVRFNKSLDMAQELVTI